VLIEPFLMSSGTLSIRQRASRRPPLLFKFRLVCRPTRHYLGVMYSWAVIRPEPAKSASQPTQMMHGLTLLCHSIQAMVHSAHIDALHPLRVGIQVGEFPGL
jgi:hypothetical protein